MNDSIAIFGVFTCKAANTAAAAIGMNVLHAGIDIMVMTATHEMDLTGRSLHSGVSYVLQHLTGGSKCCSKLTACRRSLGKELQCMCSSELWIYRYTDGAYIACNLFPDKKHVNTVIR